MIIESVCNIFIAMIKSAFSWINLPRLPAIFTYYFNFILNVFTDSMKIVFVFFNQRFLVAFIPIVIAVINLEHVFSFTMFILRKIPFLGIK